MPAFNLVITSTRNSNTDLAAKSRQHSSVQKAVINTVTKTIRPVLGKDVVLATAEGLTILRDLGAIDLDADEITIVVSRKDSHGWNDLTLRSDSKQSVEQTDGPERP